MTDDITRYRGDTWPDTITVIDKLGNPIDISTFTFVMTLDNKSEPVDETTRLYQLDGEVVNGPNGIVEFSPTEEQADRAGIYYYDVKMIDGTGRKKTIKKAAYVYSQDIG
jgi:hypothetical protein